MPTETLIDPINEVWINLNKEQRREVLVKAYDKGLFALWPSIACLFLYGLMDTKLIMILPFYSIVLIWNFLRRKIVVILELYPDKISKQQLDAFLEDDEPITPTAGSDISYDLINNPALSSLPCNIYHFLNK